jgi:uncharacterized damage-inducible protein DinB
VRTGVTEWGTNGELLSPTASATAHRLPARAGYDPRMAKTLLQEALDGWRYAREGVVAELENIPAESFDFRPVSTVRTVAELARHIAESSAVMVGELTRADGDFTRQSYPEHLKEHAADLDPRQDKDALLALLRDSLEAGVERFRDAGELRMLQLITQFNGEPATRLSWMSHGVAHEDYHRGQLCVYARQLGLVPALTKRIHGG